MREALMQIREELGEDAVILKTERVPGGFLSLGGKAEIEVTAGADETSTKRTQTFDPLKMKDTGVYRHPHHTVKHPRIPDVPPAPLRPIPPERPSVTRIEPASSKPPVEHNDDSRSLQEIKKELDELRAMVRSVVAEKGTGGDTPDLSGEWEVLYQKLANAEVKPEIARALIDEVRQSADATNISSDETFMTALSACFPVTGPIQPKTEGPLMVAFVGPTGAGKTTTLAKLAAHYVANKGLNVSIITSDTYRIAAIEQIRTFADIVGVGLQVVFSPDEIEIAREACHNDDIVLIDTAGRSQKNQEHMDELREILGRLNADQTHLVLSAATKDSDLNDLVTRYRSAGADRLLFTKVDETVRLGNILNTVITTGMPVSYFAVGQSVPDDIEVAHARRFVQRLWEGVGR